MHSFCKHIAVFITTLFISAQATSQYINTKVFSINDDATSPKMLSLIKHSSGFLLVGTMNGLYRFTGNDFEAYKFKAGVKNKAISAIAELNADTTLVGFQTGEIGRLVNNTIELLNPEEGYPKVAITAILIDKKGIIYYSTAGEGIYYYTNRKFYNINTDDGLSDNYVYDIKATLNNTIIAATDHGINSCTIINGKKKIQFYASGNGIPDNIVRALAPIDNNRYTVGMQDAGIGSFNLINKRYQPLFDAKNWKYEQTNSILNFSNTTWIGTENNGLLRSTNGILSKINLKTLSPINKINNLLADNEGNIWFTSNHQLVKTTANKLENIIPIDTKLFPQIHTILADKKNGIWINDNTGLIHYTTLNGSWKSSRITLPLVTEKIDITSLYQDKFENIWIGTMGKGIIILNPATGKTRNITEDPVLIDASVLSINGRENDIWISSLSGPIHCKLNDNNADIKNTYNFINFNNVSGIGSNYVYSILPDCNNRVWFATDGKGLTLYQNGKFTNYSEKSGLKSKVIYNICEDPEGNIWFSTLNAGIYKFDGKSFTNINVETGLNDATVTSLSTDNKGNILAVTKKGVNIINRKTYSITYINSKEDIEELNTDPNCITKTMNGDALFVTSDGIVKFSANYKTQTPAIVIDNVQLFLNDILLKDQQAFKYDENNLSFSFSGISLSDPDKLQYQYQLQGLSNTWISTRDTKINFPKLPPGTYTFVVRASLNNNFSNSPSAAYHFTINKPFWLQWWFIVLSIIVVAIALFLFIKNREKRLERYGKLEKERIQSQFETLKSQVNPHFLFNSFNTLIAVIEENPDKAVEYVEHLSDFYRKIVTYRNKNLLSLGEELDLINDYYFIQQKRFGKNLLLTADVDPSDLNAYLIAPLTLQLLAENAVKHNAISCDTPLEIYISIVDQKLVVRNNLNSKMTPEKGAGMGLQNIVNRYKLLATEDVTIEKTESEFIVTVPLIKATNEKYINY